MINLLLFIIGLALLVKGADWLVEGASTLASRFGVPELVIGLTVVAFGTSLPEMLVSVVSSAGGHTDLAIGNVLGSNIANILLVLGLAAIARDLPVKDSTVLSEIPFSLAAALLVGFLANAALFADYVKLSISRLDGLILIFFFFLFMVYVYRLAIADTETYALSHPKSALRKPLLFVATGIAGLYFGGMLVVEAAVDMSQALGVSESLIALTIVAIGTSMPELFASVVAAYKGNTDIAVGNVVGSNIFNLLWVLGVAATVRELPFDLISNADIVMVIFSGTLPILMLVLSRRGAISRWNGFVCLSIYVAYVAYLIDRG